MRRVLVFLNETAAPANYTLSLHDALPISRDRRHGRNVRRRQHRDARAASLHEAGPARVPARNGAGLRSEPGAVPCRDTRSEEHTSELQSQSNLVRRLLPVKEKAWVSLFTL